MTEQLTIEKQRDGAWIVVALFWAAFYVIVTMVDHLSDDTAILFLPRAVISLTGLLLSLTVVYLRTVVARSVNLWRIVALLIFAVSGSALQVLANYANWHFLAADMRTQIDGVVYLGDVVHWFWIYATQLGIVFALDYSREVSDRERRIAVLDRAAHQAKLRALRYQLNPHFIFNTLNSIASLIGKGEPVAAERMIEDLSDFLRTTLAIDPHADVTLAEELELQSRYLAIETRRFPDRLKIEMDVHPGAMQALIPCLITQPLTENVIRHAVATSDNVVVLKVMGRQVNDDLEICITNTGGSGDAVAPSTGIGLVNVNERLRTRFQDNHSFVAKSRPDGGFAATIRVPFVVAR